MGDRTILVSYTDDPTEPEKMKTYRVAVRAVSYMDRAHYYALQREGMEWFQSNTNLTMEQELDDPEHVAMRNLVYFRAEMLCAVEREKVSDGTAYLCQYKNGTGAYERHVLPREWTTLEGMATHMPTPLMDEWLEATRKLNAGVLPSIPDFFPQAAVVTSTFAT